MNALVLIGVAIFISVLIYTIYTVNTSIAGGDNRTEIRKAIQNVTIVNLVMIAVLGGIGTVYITANPVAERPYVLILLHTSLFLSVLGASTSVIQKIDQLSKSA